MPDQYTDVTTTSYGSRIANSFKNIIAGFLLVIAAVGALYWNEGRVDLSKIAINAIQIDARGSAANQVPTGTLVSTTGVVTSEEEISDVFLAPKNYVAWKRITEMYAWVEHCATEKRTNNGGSETSTTNCSYTKEWTASPSTNLKHPEGHENPELLISSLDGLSAKAKIGAYYFDTFSTGFLQEFATSSLNASNTTIDEGNTSLQGSGLLSPSEKGVLAGNNYVFIKKTANGTFEQPYVGDLRISYKVLEPGFTATLFGKLNGDKIEPYEPCMSEGCGRLYRLFTGTRAQALDDLHGEYSTMGWVVRIVGFLMIWIGLMALLGPISIILDFFPVFGAISRSIVAVATFALAVVLTVVTISVSLLVHNLIVLIIAILAILGIIVWLMALRRKRKVIAQPPASLVS